MFFMKIRYEPRLLNQVQTGIISRPDQFQDAAGYVRG